jgi:DUF971 family protein
MQPKSIKADKSSHQLIIDWSDGHKSEYAFNLLRAGCPCATCRGGHENMKPEPDEIIFNINLPESPATVLENVELVGSYAISILWQDGHHYGIYNWHYLRALCPCIVCRG